LHDTCEGIELDTGTKTATLAITWFASGDSTTTYSWGRNSASACAFPSSRRQSSVSFLKPSLLRGWQTQERHRLKQQILSTLKMIETSTLRWKTLKKTPQRTPKIHQALPSTTKLHRQRPSLQARYHIKIEKIRRYGSFCPRWMTMPLLYAPCTLFPLSRTDRPLFPILHMAPSNL
jgi:hypothetical protein